MEQSLVVYEAPTQPAPMQPTPHMQHIAETSQSSAATIGSIVTAATADMGVDQPTQQPMAIAAVPFSFGEGGATAPETQLQAALADLLASRKQADLAHKQFVASSKDAEKDLRALLSAHAPPALQPMQAPKQKPPQQKPPQPKQPVKQPQHQPAKPPAKQAAPLFAEVLAAGRVV
jgi:hypothetical protein